MFERFTERARKIMSLADEEARRMNHACIDTEHVLLGMVEEGSGVGANVLTNLGAESDAVRREVEKLVKPGLEKPATVVRPQTPGTKQVVEFAIEEARNLGHNYVGSEHLLLGLMRVKEGIASRVLGQMGITQDDVTAAIRQLLNRGQDTAKPVVSAEVDEMIELATDEAAEMGDTHVRCEHVLLALMQHRGGLARKVLRGLGLSAAKIREEIAKHPPAGHQ